MLKYIRTITTTTLVVAALGLASCETMNGAGRDIENAGQSVQGASK